MTNSAAIGTRCRNSGRAPPPTPSASSRSSKRRCDVAPCRASVELWPCGSATLWTKPRCPLIRRPRRAHHRLARRHSSRPGAPRPARRPHRCLPPRAPGRLFSSGGSPPIRSALARRLLSNVHGLFIYEREGNEVFFHMSANARVTTDPSMFLNGMASSFDVTSGLGEREQTAVALIALSKTAHEPLAEAALCISAVEYLSTDAPWTPAQLELLTKLQAQAAASTELPQDEAKEVAEGVRGVFKSIRQSIKRKMTALGLTETQRKSFDDMYSVRSRIFHGSITGRDRHTELATKAREICSCIVMAAANKTRFENATN